MVTVPVWTGGGGGGAEKETMSKLMGKVKMSLCLSN
jgi:hypothetical protein